jgi:hypothetical protein
VIEVYGFLAAFAVQVLALSVLFPARLSRYIRAQSTSLPAQRLAKLYPGVDLELARERFLTRFRVVNGGIAVLGLLLLGWLFTYMRGPDWNERTAILLPAAYCMLQYLPLVFVSWLGFKLGREHRQSLLEGKRKATLQRRGLFDFISPFMVFVVFASYFLFVGVVMYVQWEPWRAIALIVVLTLTYLLQSLVVYLKLYGKRGNPLETDAARLHAIGLTVRTSAYGLILVVAFFAFVFAVDVLHLKRWVPLAQTICLLISTRFCLMSLSAPPRQPDANGAEEPT